MSENGKKALAFIGSSLFFSWLLIGVFFAFGGAVGDKGANILAVVYVFVPGIVAIFLQKVVYASPIKKGLGLFFKPNFWFLTAWITAPLIALAVNEVGLRLPWNEYSPEMNGFFDMIAKTRGADEADKIRNAVGMLPLPFFWIMFIQGMVGGATFGALFALFEEVGFRGFLLSLMPNRSFRTSSLLIGLAWGIWAAPMVILKQQYFTDPLTGAGMMIVYCLLASPIYLYFRLKSKSVVGSALFGGTLSGLSAIPLLMVEGENHLTVGMNGVPGFIVLALAMLLIVVFDRFISDAPVTVKAEVELASDADIPEEPKN